MIVSLYKKNHEFEDLSDNNVLIETALYMTRTKDL